MAVISDLHLGMRGCRAAEVLAYLRSIDPEILVLNGDIVDVWQFKKTYFPPEHMLVVRELLDWIAKQKTVYYVTGNHDEVFRRFVGFQTGQFKIVNKVVLTLDGKKTWIFHGDVFDVTMQHSKWLAMLGGKGYDALIWLNHHLNKVSVALGRGRISLSKKVKESVKSAVKFINHFEETAANIAIRNGYNHVVCGHIHQPADRMVVTSEGSVRYLNSGDWVENCTALEYHCGTWRLHRQVDAPTRPQAAKSEVRSIQELFQEMLAEMNVA